MNIKKTSYNLNTLSNTAKKPGVSKQSIPRDTFVKSTTNASLSKVSNLTIKNSTDILFSQERKVLRDPFGLKANDLYAGSATVDPETGNFFAGLAENRDNGKNFLAAFNPNGSMRWKVEHDKPVVDITPDKKGGVVLRLWANIYSYDGDGNKNWEFSIPNTGGFYEMPVVGPDNTVYYATHKKEQESNENNMSVVAVKDGKLKWLYERENHFLNNLDMIVTKKGDLLLTVHEERNPKSLLRKMTNKKDKKNFLVCLNPDGSKKFEIEVDTNEHKSVRPVESPDGSIIYVDKKDNAINSISPDGELKWSCPVKNISSDPVVDEKGNIYIATGDTQLMTTPPKSSLICIDGKSGKQRWNHRVDNRAIKSSPIFKDDSLYLPVTGELGAVLDDCYLKMDKNGNNQSFVKKTGDDGSGFVYLENNELLLNSDKEYQIRTFGLEEQISQESIDELSGNDTENVNNNEGKIQLKEKTVVIGGVELEKRK